VILSGGPYLQTFRNVTS